ncbi:MAG: hypothetical protein IKY65_04660 [Rikenellaceae bacterium]|nr:hypothetical protein [Rikenellaceae bacterium]
MNLLTINLSDEDRARIDKLCAGVSALADSLSALAYVRGVRAEDGAAAPAAEPPAAAPAPAPYPPEDAVPWEPAPEPAAAPAPVSLAKFQKALSLRCAESAETKARVRALLNEYAAAASAVPEEKRAEVLARLAQL